MQSVYKADHLASFYSKNTTAQERGEATPVEEDPTGSDDGEPAEESDGEQDESDSSDDDLPLHYVGRQEDDLPLHLINNARSVSMEGRAWKRSGKKPEPVYDEDGNDITEEDPLASLRANYVWESLSDGVRVMLEGPLSKQPQNTTAFENDQRQRSKYKFYSRMSVQDEFGDIYWFDLREDVNSMAVVFYDTDSTGDKILWFADILAIYVNPSGEPMIEHGYLFDRDEIASDKSCKKFLKATERGPAGRIADNELVNCNNVYHTHAGCVEGKEQLVKSAEPPPDLPPDAFFWRRVVDLKTGREHSAASLTKAVLID